MKSPKHENYYDNKFHIFEELKMEVPDTEVPHSDCNVNDETVSEEISKFNDLNEIKHEAMENRQPLNVTIRTERIIEGEIIDNNKNMSVPYKLTVKDVELYSDDRLLKNVNLLNPNNEQTNMARVAELNEKCKHCDIHFDHHDDMLIHIRLIHNKKSSKCELCGKQLYNVSSLKRHIKLIHKHKEPPKKEDDEQEDSEEQFPVPNLNDGLNADQLENMKSPNHDNYYDNKFHIFEELKMEVPDTELPHSDCNVNNEIVSEEISKFNDQNEMKHAAMENGQPLNVTIKTERIIDGEIIDKNKNMSVPYKLTVQHVQLNSDVNLLKNNVNLLNPDNEQTKMARVAELNELYIYKCKHCDIAFNHHDDMLIHIRLIHNKKSSKCELCGKQLYNVSSLKRHMKLIHKESPKIAEIIFKCINCNAGFNNKLTLNDHAKLCQKEEEIITYKCDSCYAVYKDEQNLRNHVKRMHTNKGHKCKWCGVVLTMKNSLTTHMKSIHYDYGHTFDCWCGKQFRSPLRLRVHERRQHERKIKDTSYGRYQCDSCQKIFKYKQSLALHIKKLHYDYGRMFNCWCGKRFRSPIHLKIHKQLRHERRIEDTDNKFQCESCQKFFKNKQSLVVHIKRSHYEYGRTFGCWCGKQYRSPFHLSAHKHQRHKRKIKHNYKFQCDSCQKFFTKKQSLIIHIKRVHHDYGKTFGCWCGKQFRSPLHLLEHKRRHDRMIKGTDNCKLQCESCQKSFKEKLSLFIHVKKCHYESESTSDC